MLNSKYTTILGLIAAIVGALSGPEVLDKLPASVALGLTIAGSIVAALSKALVDADGDGIPDAFQRRGTGA